jgi:aryl-alcohol dehydrogenase-like predicted oxidoreductase
MNHRPLGHTGINVSEIAFGGVEIGIPYGIGVRSRADMMAEPEAIRLLHAAVDGGINFFDTARMYGASESIMGQAFMGLREQIVICTKCRHLRNESRMLPRPGKIKELIKRSLQQSLAALQTGFVDIYMLHQVDAEIIDNKAIAEYFTDLKRDGIIRATGVSTYTVEETRKAIESGRWDVIQLPFNLLDQSQETLFTPAAEKGIGIMVRSVLCKGILSDKGRNLHPELKAVEQHRNLYSRLFSKTCPDLTSLAIKFALSFDQVSSVLVGIDKTDYLQKSLDVADGNYLDHQTLMQAKELQYPDTSFLDLVKWDRMGWLT